MERPTVLLAVAEDGEAYVDALRRAGFEPISVDPGQVPTTAAPHVDMGVVDCDLPAEVVAAIYEQLQNAKVSTTLLLVSASTDLPAGVGGSHHGRLKRSADALVYRLRHFHSTAATATESGAWAATIPELGADRRRAHVVSVFAPRRVGKTTVAVNMAVALRSRHAPRSSSSTRRRVGNVTAVLTCPTDGLADLGTVRRRSGRMQPSPSWHAPRQRRARAHVGTDPAESERITVDLLLAALRWARDTTRT